MRVLVRHATQINLDVDSIRLCQVIITLFSGRIAVIKNGWVLWVIELTMQHCGSWVNCVGIWSKMMKKCQLTDYSVRLTELLHMYLGRRNCSTYCIRNIQKGES